MAEGGARAIGDGVFLTMSGVMPVGLEVVDVHGKTYSYPYPGNNPSIIPAAASMFDPFIFVRKSRQSV